MLTRGNSRVQMVDIDLMSEIGVRTSFIIPVTEWRGCMQLPDVEKARSAYYKITVQCRDWMDWIKDSARGQ